MTRYCLWVETVVAIDTPMAYYYAMIIIETSVFTRQVSELMSDEEYLLLQAALIFEPDRGDLIPRSGGLRKIRWKAEGRGKRGGSRIIYYWQAQKDQIYMLLAYSKNQQENLTNEQLKVLRKLVEQEFN